jgi:hypothetical protein
MVVVRIRSDAERMTVMRYIPVVLLIYVFGPGTAAAQQPREEYSAIAVSAGGPLSNPVAGRLLIDVERLSTDEERQRFIDALTKSQDVALETLQRLPPVGSVRTPGTLRWAIRYAQATEEDGRRRIFLITDRPLSFDEVAGQPRTVKYPFAVIELFVDKQGEGEGNFHQAVRIQALGKRRVLGIENYTTAPVTLTEVERR